MKIILATFISLLFINCNSSNNSKELQNRILKIENKINNSYKPGLGVIMNSVQTHHFKLWFAGQNENWDLAKFEIHELKERLVDIKIYHSKSKEAQLLKIIKPSLVSIEKDLELKDLEIFNKNYNDLTVSCNMCHQATNHDFIKIKTPSKSAYSNQVY